MRLTATTLAGLEEVLAEELRELGASSVQPFKRAVGFEGDKEMLYRANLELRTALRVLVHLHTFKAKNEQQLYQRIFDIDWQQYMSVRDTLAVDATASSSIFRHSKYAALKTKDAICDRFRKETGRRPYVNVLNPALRINLHIHNDHCILSLDSSGDSLHRRGYRTDTGEAPINEVLAAGMIGLTGWKQDRCFIDPMCGSGTLLIEAAFQATNRAPQLNRDSFGFMRWPDYEAELWQKLVEQSKNKITEFSHGLYGYDKDFKARRMAQHNAAAAGLEGIVTIERQPIERLEAPEPSGLIVMNPPYDERMLKDDIGAFYEMIGDRLKQAFTGYDAWIISSNLDAIKRVGLRPSAKIDLFNGPLECKFQKYELYAGTKKVRET
jgi:putative N6-adenine-specific DNA methylase